MNQVNQIAFNEAQELQIKFNPSKTICMTINDHVIIRSKRYIKDNEPISMNSVILETTGSLKYLGNLIQKLHEKCSTCK